MSVDATSLLIGVAAGGAVGLGASYLTFYYRGGRKVQVLQRDETGRLRRKSVTTDDLEKSKRDMRTLVLERDLLSAALTKVYEAENDGQITREEREEIAKRYSAQIRDLEAKLRDKELVVEVGELEKLREELVTLFQEKIQNIEARLDQAKERLPALAAPAVKAEAPRPPRPQPAQQEDLERVVERKTPKRDDTEGERRVRAIRDEVMDALARLEQIDTKKEAEGA
jgi:hypothetical protein